MPYTVWGAFDKFRKDSVDLDPGESDRAISSRGYLYDQAKALSSSDSDFPAVSSYIPFGSFARKTKIRPLDDIDLLFVLNGRGTTSQQSQNNAYEYWLKISDANAPLAKFRDAYGFVSSVKVLNQIKKSLGKVKNYGKAELKRNEQAVILNLTSYPWVFDIVPAVSISSYYDSSKTEYYLIPDGSGDWMRTDPRKDTEYVTRVSKQHNGYLLPTMRLLKYWNWRTYKPRLPSYYFETLALKVFDNLTTISDYPTAIRTFFSICPIYLDGWCSDPKGLGPNLDKDVDAETKKKVKNAMNEVESFARQAVLLEIDEKHAAAMIVWQRVFGPSFPGYGT